MIGKLIVPVYLVLCLLLGGASIAGFLPNLVLQLLAVALIALAFVAPPRGQMSKPSRSLLALTVLLLLVLILQIVPLPPSVWTTFPGREPISDVYSAIGEPLPWLPVSLTPERALASTLWLLPSIAVMLGIVRGGLFKADWIAWVILGVTALSIAMGALQIANARQDNPAYLYARTNYGVAVGFFANANHEATLMLVAIAFTAALVVARSPRRLSRDRAAGGLIGYGALFILFIIGLAINRSLAGLGLAVPVAGASLMLSKGFRKRVNPWLGAAAVALLSVAALVVVFTAPVGNNLVGEEASSSESRAVSISKTLQAGSDYFPMGSGFASFVDIYRTLEDPQTVTTTYMNHAHSDYAELFLELGLTGIILVLLFFVWWVRRAVAVWRAAGDPFARAASIASGAILIHSLVDYPLRTAAIGAIFTACCALMAEPRERESQRQDREGRSQVRHLTA